MFPPESSRRTENQSISPNKIILSDGTEIIDQKEVNAFLENLRFPPKISLDLSALPEISMENVSRTEQEVLGTLYVEKPHGKKRLKYVWELLATLTQPPHVSLQFPRQLSDTYFEILHYAITTEKGTLSVSLSVSRSYFRKNKDRVDFENELKLYIVDKVKEHIIENRF